MGRLDEEQAVFNGKWFLFRVNGLSHSQDIEIFVLNYRSCGLVTKIALLSKFMTSQLG